MPLRQKNFSENKWTSYASSSRKDHAGEEKHANIYTAMETEPSKNNIS